MQTVRDSAFLVIALLILVSVRIGPGGAAGSGEAAAGATLEATAPLLAPGTAAPWPRLEAPTGPIPGIFRVPQTPAAASPQSPPPTSVVDDRLRCATSDDVPDTPDRDALERQAARSVQRREAIQERAVRLAAAVAPAERRIAVEVHVEELELDADLQKAARAIEAVASRPEVQRFLQLEISGLSPS